MDRQAARICKVVNIGILIIPILISLSISISLSGQYLYPYHHPISLSHLSRSGCIVVHVLEDGDEPELNGEGGGLAGDHLKQLGAHVN